MSHCCQDHARHSFVEIITDDDGNIIGILHGGNQGGGPGAYAEARKAAGEPVIVEENTTLHDVIRLFVNEVRRATVTLRDLGD